MVMKMKKITSFVCAFLLACSACPVSAFALDVAAAEHEDIVIDGVTYSFHSEACSISGTKRLWYLDYTNQSGYSYYEGIVDGVTYVANVLDTGEVQGTFPEEITIEDTSYSFNYSGNYEGIVPDVGFLFPSFVERSTDIHSLTYYVRDAKDSHRDFIETALGCGAKRTATEEQNTFGSIVKAAIAPIIEDSDGMLLDIQEKLNDIVEEHEATLEDLVIIEPEELTLTPEMIKDVLADSEIPDATVALIQSHFTEEFSDQPPTVKNLVNEKAIEKNNKEKKEIKLQEEVATLKQELNDTKQENLKKTEQIETLVKMEAPLDPDEAKNWAEVFLRMKPDKAQQVKAQTIDGQKYLLIPMEENEHINLNGVETTV